jgi:hypothetical protein
MHLRRRWHALPRLQQGRATAHAVGLQGRSRQEGLSQLTAKGWDRTFDDPVPLPDGRELATLRDAAVYVQSLPRATQKREEWQRAVRILIAAAEGRDFLMHASRSLQLI